MVSLREEPIIISSLLFPLQVAAIHVIMLSSIDAEPISFASKTFNVPNDFWVKYGKPVTHKNKTCYSNAHCPLNTTFHSTSFETAYKYMCNLI